MKSTTVLSSLLPLIVGTTKKQLAFALDAKSPLFNYSVESGPTSYHNYDRNTLVQHCIQFEVDVVSEHEKMGRTIAWQKQYAEVTGTEFRNYNANIHQGEHILDPGYNAELLSSNHIDD